MPWNKAPVPRKRTTIRTNDSYAGAGGVQNLAKIVQKPTLLIRKSKRLEIRINAKALGRLILFG